MKRTSSPKLSPLVCSSSYPFYYHSSVNSLGIEYWWQLCESCRTSLIGGIGWRPGAFFELWKYGWGYLHKMFCQLFRTLTIVEKSSQSSELQHMTTSVSNQKPSPSYLCNQKIHHQRFILMHGCSLKARLWHYLSRFVWIAWSHLCLTQIQISLYSLDSLPPPYDWVSCSR